MLLSQYSRQNSYPLGEDGYWMQEAFFKAQESFLTSYPNPPVGALLVHPKRGLIGSSFTQVYGGKHAERLLLEGQDPGIVAECDLFTTLSPCTHQGKQPPCSEIVLQYKPRRVVYAIQDANPMVHNADPNFQKELRKFNIAYKGGVLYELARSFYAPFFTYVTANRPFLAAKWAVSIDFAMADDLATSQWITSSAMRSYTHWLRRYYHAILLGAGSVLKDNPRLNSRMSEDIREPIKILYDPKSQIVELPSFWNQDLDFIIAPQAPSWAARRGFVALDASLDQVLTHKISGVQSILVEGGPHVHTLLLPYYDRIHSMVGPKIIGKSRFRPILDNALNLKEVSPLRLVSCHRLDDDVLMEYER